MNKEPSVNFYQKYKPFIFIGIVAFSSLILIIFVIYPQISKLIANQKIEGEIISKTKFLDDKARALENYDKSDLDRKVALALDSYPPDKDFISAFSLLQNVVSRSGFTIVSINLGSGSLKTANTDSYDLKVDILGPSSLVPVLLNNIESLSRLMRVRSVETVAGIDPQVANITLDVNVLFSPTPPGYGSVDSPIQELSQKDEDVIAKLGKAANSIPATQSATLVAPRGKSNPFQ